MHTPSPVLYSKTIKDSLIEVVECTPDLNDQCIELDRKAEMSVYLCGLVRFGRNISIPYHEIIKYKGYQDGFVLVAKKGQQCIGKVAIGIRDLNLFGKKERTAYIFDMRIALQHQRGGIGRLLYETIEKVAVQRGCTVGTCYVNYNNTKSINFFLKTNGFSLGSERRMYIGTSISEEPSPVRKVTLSDGSECVVEFFKKGSSSITANYHGVDVCPMDMQDFQVDKHYIGMMRAANGDSAAQWHLYQGDSQFGMSVQRLFLEKQTWEKPYARVLVAMFLMAGPLGMILGSLNYNPLEIKSKGLFGAGIGLAAFFGVLQILFYKAYGYLTSKYIRAFGYEFKGNKNEKQIFTELSRETKRYAHSIGASSVRINEDIRSPSLQYLTTEFRSFGSNIVSVYLYKYFDQTVKRDNKLITEHNFFDPRM